MVSRQNTQRQQRGSQTRQNNGRQQQSSSNKTSRQEQTRIKREQIELQRVQELKAKKDKYDTLKKEASKSYVNVSVPTYFSPQDIKNLKSKGYEQVSENTFRKFGRQGKAGRNETVVNLE